MWGIQQASTWPNTGPNRFQHSPFYPLLAVKDVLLHYSSHPSPLPPFFSCVPCPIVGSPLSSGHLLKVPVRFSIIAPHLSCSVASRCNFYYSSEGHRYTLSSHTDERQPQRRHDTSKRNRSTAWLGQPVFHAKSTANGTAAVSSEPDGHFYGHSSDVHGFWPQWSNLIPTSIPASAAGPAATTSTEFYTPKYPAFKPDSGLHASTYVLTHRRWSSRKYDATRTAWKQHRASCNLPAPHKSIGAYASKCISHGYELTSTTSNATTTTAAANGYVAGHVHDDEAGRASWHASQFSEGATCSNPTSHEQFDPSSVHESGFASRWNAAISSPNCVSKWHASATSTTIITETKFAASESCR